MLKRVADAQLAEERPVKKARVAEAMKPPPPATHNEIIADANPNQSIEAVNKQSEPAPHAHPGRKRGHRVYEEEIEFYTQEEYREKLRGRDADLDRAPFREEKKDKKEKKENKEKKKK